MPVPLLRLSLEEMRRFSPLFGEDARGIDVMASLRSRDVPGGTAPRQVSAALRRARKRIADMGGEPAPGAGTKRAAKRTKKR